MREITFLHNQVDGEIDTIRQQEALAMHTAMTGVGEERAKMTRSNVFASAEVENRAVMKQKATHSFEDMLAIYDADVTCRSRLGGR